MIVNWNLSANQINLTVYEQGVDLLASVLKKTVKSAHTQLRSTVYYSLTGSKTKNQPTPMGTW